LNTYYESSIFNAISLAKIIGTLLAFG